MCHGKCDVLQPPPGETPPTPGLSPQPPIISMEDDEMSDQEMVSLVKYLPVSTETKLLSNK